MTSRKIKPTKVWINETENLMDLIRSVMEIEEDKVKEKLQNCITIASELFDKFEADPLERTSSRDLNKLSKLIETCKEVFDKHLPYGDEYLYSGKKELRSISNKDIEGSLSQEKYEKIHKLNEMIENIIEMFRGVIILRDAFDDSHDKFNNQIIYDTQSIFIIFKSYCLIAETKILSSLKYIENNYVDINQKINNIRNYIEEQFKSIIKLVDQNLNFGDIKKNLNTYIKNIKDEIVHLIDTNISPILMEYRALYGNKRSS